MRTYTEDFDKFCELNEEKIYDLAQQESCDNNHVLDDDQPDHEPSQEDIKSVAESCFEDLMVIPESYLDEIKNLDHPTIQNIRLSEIPMWVMKKYCTEKVYNIRAENKLYDKNDLFPNIKD